jgi:septum formation topological specificity factor MinE
MSSHKGQRSLVLAVLFALGSMLAVVFALQSIASNAQTSGGFQVAQAPTTPPATTPQTTTPQTTTPQTTTPPATSAAVPPTAPSLIVGGVDIGKQATDSLKNLRSILEGITDATSAEAARQRLQVVMGDIERFAALYPQLTPEQRTALSGLLKPEMPTLNQLFDKVLAIPGVAQVLKPTVDALRPKLAVLSGPNLIVGGVDIGKQATDTISNLRSILEGITDVASAEAARPRLQEVIAQLEKLDTLYLQFTPDQRAAIAGLVNPEMPTLNQLFDKVLAIPGVAKVLKPTIDALRPKLALLGTTTSEGAVVEIVIKEDKDECIKPRRGQKLDPSCCVEKIRLVRGGGAQFTTFSGRTGNLTEVNTVACVSPTGEISYWKSTESILGFDVAAAMQPPGAPPGAPGAPGAPGGAPGAPPAPATPPATPISTPGGGSTTPPIIIIPQPPVTPPACMSPGDPNCP